MTYKLITEAELHELTNMVCGRGGSLARAHAVLRAVQEREGPKWCGEIYDRSSARRERYYTIPGDKP